MMYITYIDLIICGRSSSVAGILKSCILYYTIVLYICARVEAVIYLARLTIILDNNNNNNLLNCSVYYFIFLGLDDLVRLQ